MVDILWTRGTLKEQLFGVEDESQKLFAQRGGRCGSLKMVARATIVHAHVTEFFSVFIFSIFVFSRF